MSKVRIRMVYHLCGIYGWRNLKHTHNTDYILYKLPASKTRNVDFFRYESGYMGSTPRNYSIKLTVSEFFIENT